MQLGKPRRAVQLGLKPRQARLSHGDPHLGPEPRDVQNPLGAIRFHINPPDHAVPLHDGEDIIAVFALRFGYENLDPVVKAEQALGAFSIT